MVWVPLHDAVERGKTEDAQRLLTCGAEVNEKAEGGTSALHVAAGLMWGSQKMVELLLANGADASARTSRGETPLHVAARKEAGFDNTFFDKGQNTVVQMLLAHGSNFNAKNSAGETPLHAAAKQGRENMALLLLEKGANVSAKTAAGETPLYLAASLGLLPMVQLFLEHGASVTTTTNEFETPLHALARAGCEHAMAGPEAAGEISLEEIDEIDEQVARLLLEHGASVVVKNIAGETPEDLATAWRPRFVAYDDASDCSDADRRANGRPCLLALLKQAAVTPISAKKRPRKHARSGGGESAHKHARSAGGFF